MIDYFVGMALSSLKVYIFLKFFDLFLKTDVIFADLMAIGKVAKCFILLKPSKIKDEKISVFSLIWFGYN